MQQIGPTIRAARERLGLTQAQLGERLGWQQGLVSRYEAGKREPSVSVLCRIADALGMVYSYDGETVRFRRSPKRTAPQDGPGRR